MKKIISLILALAVSAQAFAAYETPLARSSKVSEVEYRAFLLSEPDYKPASLEILKARPLPHNAQILRERYETAERAFISADLANAHQTYLEVTHMAFTDDWSEAQRAMIFHSFLRAAQTASAPSERFELLRNASRFSMNKKIDRTLFPPPLVEEFENLREPTIAIVLPKPFRNYSYVIINGEVSELKNYMLKAPAGEFRITLISDHLAPVTRVLSASALKAWTPKSDFLVGGDCKNAHFHSQLPMKAAGLFQADCIARKNELPGTSPTLIEQTLQNRDPYLNLQADARPAFYKNKWFWGAVGVIAIAVAMDRSRDKERDAQPEPTVKDGF